MKAFLAAAALTFMVSVGLSSTDAKSISQPIAGFPTEGEWTSLTEKVQFLPAPDEGSPLLRQEQRRSLSYYSDHFVDGQETQYNEYAQAWRLLGLYIDCNSDVEEEGRRQLEDGGDNNGDEDGADANEDGQEEQDGNEQDQEGDQEEEVEEEEDDGSVCKRQLLWAAYVDLDYEGNGLSEYMIFDSSTNSWDKTACKASESSTRCVKMDCHQRGTNFKPLGYFLEDAPADFLQLLAQHQGSCTWNEAKANAVEGALEWLPQECTQTEIVVHNAQGSATYAKLDLKPKQGGGIDIGLYTDYKCSEEYTGSEITVADALTKHHGYDVDYDTTIGYINAAVDAFKVCMPCRTFDLSYTPSQNQNAEDDGEENAEEEGDPNNANFVCQDSAGYAGVNQCKMLAQNAQKASFREITLASQQGTILRTYASVDTSETWWQAWGFFTISLIVFVLGMICFCTNAVKRKRISSSEKNQPLLRQ